MADKKFLDSVYNLKSSTDSKLLYGDWSDSYDNEVGSEGYATPGRIVNALVQFTDTNASVLDYGCGTGLAGIALKESGFSNLTGWDITPEMLEKAKAKDIYANTQVIAADTDLPDETSEFDVIVCCGVIGTGAAPPSVFDQIMHAIKSGGLFCFSYNDHTLAEIDYTSRLSDWVDCGAASLLFKEHGPHLPGKDMESTVYVLRKA
ncbi:class I SAM-dependent DNA methyltransferase [Halocynthiibacter namhaensis]|uniref:class I SAM-dependent DNA methyltransferase n=1 Tax=Halocynthiibacter namhaensis TaxID=1290553 RepID=UPI00057940F4|nr:class I SAM-dependent methyltransferase [Halocynthiibacter namhaensis]